LKTAEQPFRFVTASYLTRINNQKASTLDELRTGLEQTSDASIFYHTFQSLGRYHFLTEGFSNDFAQWVLTGLNRAALAEQLAGLDVRDYSSLAGLRGDLHRLVTDYCQTNPHEARQCAFETFYFCESVVVTAPLSLEATTLEEFRNGLSSLGHAGFYNHFIASRLRLELGTNDFSHWFAHALDLKDLAQRTNRIDVYTNTIETAQAEILALVDRELASGVNK
jgi:Family of unknown function (DUF5752)